MAASLVQLPRLRYAAHKMIRQLLRPLAATRVLRNLSLAASVALCVVLTPATATAKCTVPALALLWSYPANGDINVPTNAVLWALGNSWSVPSVTLDGMPIVVPVAGPRGIPLGPLAPQHDYVVRLDYGSSWPFDAGSPTVFEIRFRTGDGPVTQLPAVPVSGVQRTGYAQATCPEVINAQACFDTGQDTLFTFDVTEASAIGWLVHRQLWPARCGPAYFSYSAPPNPCFEVRAIGSGGLLGDATEYCLQPQDSAASPPSGQVPDGGPEAARPARSIATNESACSVSAGMDAGDCQYGLFLVLATALLVRRRRLGARERAGARARLRRATSSVQRFSSERDPV